MKKKTMFGDFDDDIFDDKQTTKTRSEPVILLERGPDWFFNETLSSDEQEKWLQLKFIADRFYRRKEFVAASEAYVKSIEACPSKNLGLLRDCVDGAARAFHRAGPKYRSESKKYLEDLAAMATCEDHYFSKASTALLMTGDIKALQTLLESEPQTGYLWKTLGEKYVMQSELLFALCCFMKAASSFRSSVHESKDRFREDNLALSRETESRANELLAKFGKSSDVVCKIRSFFESFARTDSKRDSNQSFEEFWFPSREILVCDDQPGS